MTQAEGQENIFQAAALVKVQSGLLQSFGQDFGHPPSQRGELLSSAAPHGVCGGSALVSLICPSRTPVCAGHQLGAFPPHQQSWVAELKQDGRARWRINGELQPPTENSSKSFRCHASREEKSGAKGHPGASCPIKLGRALFGEHGHIMPLLKAVLAWRKHVPSVALP